MKLRDLPDGCTYEEAFIKRVVQPMQRCSGQIQNSYPNQLVLLGGKTLKHGDASAEIAALKGIR
jgi:hypothetical protein